MDIGGSGGRSFPFENHGDGVTGEITELEHVQQTDMKTGEPSFWPNGQPIMAFRVTLQTQLQDSPDDDGIRTVYLRGSAKPESKSSLAAVVGAVRSATGGTDLQIGGKLTLTYTGDGVPSQRGYNPPKQYGASYQAPGVSLEPAPPQAASAPQSQPTAPAAPPTDPIVGMLGANPVTASKRASMEAAGVDLATIPGWVGV